MDKLTQKQREEKTREVSEQTLACSVAERCGFDKAVYAGEWKGYNVYKPELSGGEIAFTGLPILILVKNGEGRITKGDEIFACYNTVIGSSADDVD